MMMVAPSISCMAQTGKFMSPLSAAVAPSEFSTTHMSSPPFHPVAIFNRNPNSLGNLVVSLPAAFGLQSPRGASLSVLCKGHIVDDGKVRQVRGISSPTRGESIWADGDEWERCSSCSTNSIAIGRTLRIGYRAARQTRVFADAVGSGSNEDESLAETGEDSEELLALQKKLLQQIEERKRLLAAFSKDLGRTRQQLKAFSENEKGRGIQSDSEGSKHEQVTPSPMKTVASTAVTISPPGTAPLSDFVSSPSQQSNTRNAVDGSPKQRFEELSEELEQEDTRLNGAESVTSEKPPPLAGPNVMNVVMVAAECAPWSKTGGLGDVTGALPKALARRGHRVMVVAPRYGNYDEAWETGIRKVYNVSGHDMEVGYFHAYIDGVDFVFIDSLLFQSWSHQIYGGSRVDVLTRMILLCKAAVEVPWHVPCGGVCYGDANLVFIANDWHTALLPVYLQAYYIEKGLMPFARCILVIHNIAHQGRGPLADFGMLGLPAHYIDKFHLDDPIGGKHMNIFKAGLSAAHRIVAVSHGYAWECQTQEGGWGLDRTIRDNSWKLRGIVNGIDDKEWNPELDAFLQDDGYTNYSLETLETGKGACKAALQKELGLPVRADVPLLGFIGRLDYQKGVDIIAQALPWMMDQDLQLVMLGSGRSDLEDMLRNFENQYRDKVRGWVGFSVKTSHRITAGADILLMPSRFEPCGLNQLYAMRYGTVPVVHAVGGLKDTVPPFDPYANQGLGWTFDMAEASGLIHALGNATWTFRDFKESWRGIQKRGMSQDMSWDHAAEEYEEVLVAAKYQW